MARLYDLETCIRGVKYQHEDRTLSYGEMASLWLERCEGDGFPLIESVPRPVVNDSSGARLSLYV